MLGYPLTGASYMEIDGGYDIELTYFAECGYLENDAEKFALELNPTQ